MGYPTIRYFHRNYLESPNNIGEYVNGTTVKELTEILVERLQQSDPDLDRTWPSLSFKNFTHLSQLKIDEKAETFFLLFEHPNSTIGSEIMLDLRKYTQVNIYKVSSENEIVNTLSVKHFPSVYVIKKKSGYAKLLSIKTIRDEIKSDIIQHLIDKNVNASYKIILNQQRSNYKTSVNINNVHFPVDKLVRNTVYQTDLEAGLRYMLRHEITAPNKIHGESLIALNNYLQVLIKYFPFKANSRTFVIKLHEKISSKKEWLGKDLSDMEYNLEKLYNPVYSTALEWVGCKGSSPYFRSFNCALWTIFHVLIACESDQRASERPTVLDAMHGYVKYFFGCEECSQHFQDMAARKRMNSVAGGGAAALWLWDAHNSVNRRLAGDVTDDPMYPKRQFPDRNECPSCRYEDGAWNLDEVEKYLMYVYGTGGINFLGSIRFKTNLLSEVSTFDKAIIAVLYVYCIGASILVLYLIITKRSYSNKAYDFDFLGKI